MVPNCEKYHIFVSCTVFAPIVASLSSNITSITNNTRKRCEMCTKFTTKTTEHLQDVILVSCFNLKKNYTSFSSVFIVYFEQINGCWDSDWWLLRD